MVITGVGIIITATGVGDTTAGTIGIGDGVTITGTTVTGTTGTGIIVIGGDALGVGAGTRGPAAFARASSAE